MRMLVRCQRSGHGQDSDSGSSSGLFCADGLNLSVHELKKLEDDVQQKRYHHLLKDQDLFLSERQLAPAKVCKADLVHSGYTGSISSIAGFVSPHVFISSGGSDQNLSPRRRAFSCTISPSLPGTTSSSAGGSRTPQL